MVVVVARVLLRLSDTRTKHRLALRAGVLYYYHMTPAKRKTRTERVKRMNVILRTLYPDPKIALNYNNPWELIVAVQLSAQCTDARVNKVTEKLFKKYKTIEAYRDASQAEMEQAVFQCGFYRNKAKNIRGAAQMILSEYGGDARYDGCAY